MTSMELTAVGLDGWLLGHIHKPDTLIAPPLIGYLGSITGMDPGEPGARGPWLLTIEAGSVKDVTQWTLAPLRWERSEEHTSELQSHSFISYAVFCLKKKNINMLFLFFFLFISLMHSDTT